VAILPYPWVCGRGREAFAFEVGWSHKENQVYEKLHLPPRVHRGKVVERHRERRRAAEVGRLSSFPARFVTWGRGTAEGCQDARLAADIDGSWPFCCLLTAGLSAHLCSASAWQLGGPRVQWTNGGFLFSETHLRAQLPMGSEPQEISDGRSAWAGIPVPSFAVSLGGFSLHLFCVYFGDCHPNSPYTICVK
jgi:hypothetical protein